MKDEKVKDEKGEPQMGDAFGFVFGSTSPVVLGLMKNHFASSVGLASLAAFYLLGAALVLAARLKSRS